jgi:hypothetical protein
MINKYIIIAAVIAALTLPYTSMAQAPVFVLFSTNGAVRNTGITHLTGSVGTNNGSNTGFGNVNGVMHSADAATARCAADLLIAYNQLNAATATHFPAPLLGSGQTLTAGVYSIGSAATLNGNLLLDAQNNPSAIFIIKIQGSFSTGAAAKVKLINGALACNVYWKIEGQVNMATNTSMKGTVIANNAAITMNVGDTLEGRAMSTTGAVTVHGILGYTPIGCGSPVLTGPAAPALASAECYAIFSGNGAVSNSGITHVTGDVGTNVGLTTGYDTLLVTGKVHPIPDASTAQCAADLHTVYTYLNTLPYDIQLLYPAQFGNDLTLTPHTYWLNAATVLTGTVYLDAQGVADAVFVLKLNGALSTGTYSHVVLINGAQAKNVYWKIDGAVSINNYSTFAGTIVCNNGALNALNTGVVIDGRAFTTSGSVTTSAITATMPPGCSAGAPNISTQPSAQSACLGGSASFSAVAHGSNLTYQWRKGNSNLVNGTNISGATSAILTIDPVALSDAAPSYNVIVSGSASPKDTSASVSLTVNTAPAITTAPVSRIVCIDSLAAFSVGASGTQPTYQWRKGTVDLQDVGNVSGTRTATLTIDPVTALDASTAYNVVITGKCDPAVTSGNVSLTANTAPAITTAPVSRIECIGSSASFSAGVSGTQPTYQWRKGTVDLLDAGNVSGTRTATLTINPVTAIDASTAYNVVITGTCDPSVTSGNVSLSLCPTGIAEVLGANAVSIYPNPFAGEINLVINDASIIGKSEIKMYNMLGSEVLSANIIGFVSIINTSALPSGIYIYRVYSDGKTIQKGRLISRR